MFKIENDLLWVGSMIGLLFFLWLFTGGSARIQNGPFIKPLAPVGTGESYGNLSQPRVGSTTILTSDTSDISGSNPTSQTNRNSVSSPRLNESNSPADIRTSRYKGLITLYSGSAFYEINSNKEYITIRGSREIKTPINISGWTLKNGGRDRYYDISGQIRQGQTSSAKIPKAVLVWEKNKVMTVVPIKVEANQNVQVVSGSFPPIGNYAIRDNFRVNKCTGYIANQSGYYNIFNPNVSYNCPRVETEPGASTLYVQCYDYVRSLGTCQKPDFREDWCRAHAEDSARWTPICSLPTTCKNFVQKYASYENCVANHRLDKDFLQPEWRVFLGSTWEIWASRQETITLYDSEGKIVDQIKHQ